MKICKKQKKKDGTFYLPLNHWINAFVKHFTHMVISLQLKRIVQDCRKCVYLLSLHLSSLHAKLG